MYIYYKSILKYLKKKLLYLLYNNNNMDYFLKLYKLYNIIKYIINNFINNLEN